MPSNTRDIKRRIKSVGNIRQITRALQLVATSKMKKSQKRAQDAMVYAEAALEILENLASNKEVREHAFFKPSAAPSRLAVLITTNRGFCGGLNISVLNLFSEFVASSKKEGKEPVVITVGKKGRNFAQKSGVRMVADFSDNIERAGASEIAAISKIAVAEFLQCRCGAVYLSYARFVSTLAQQARTLQLLPLDREIISAHRNGKSLTLEHQPVAWKESKGRAPHRVLPYLYEPTIQTVFERLVPHLIEVEIYKAFLDAQASEHSARMIAMKNATEQAGDLIDDLRFSYNQVRQASITREIAEISSGALISN